MDDMDQFLEGTQETVSWIRNQFNQLKLCKDVAGKLSAADQLALKNLLGKLRVEKRYLAQIALD